MAFKLKNDLLKNFSPIRRVDMEDGVLGKANNDGTIDINKKVTDPVQFREVVKHEKIHQEQMNDLDKNGVPKLDYDDENVYWKGKVYSRSNMDEGAKDLPWEKEVYDQTENMDKNFKLKGHRGKMEQGSVLAKKGLISPMLKEGGEPKGKVGQAIENFKTRNEIVTYKKGDSNTVVVTTKKKARKAEKKEEKTQSSAPSSSKPKSSKYKPAKVKTAKAKYGIQKGKKGFQKKRKK